MTSAKSCLDCNRPVVGKVRRGRCENCYRAHLRELKERGDYTPASRPGHYDSSLPDPPGAIVLGRVEVTADGCWRYRGFISAQGYGVLDVSRKQSQIRAHRAVWEFLVGPIPSGLDLDHLCHGQDATCLGGNKCMHRRCVNPAHLEPVSAAVNTRRGLSPSGVNARKTHCPRGHEYTPENTYWRPPSKGRRYASRRCRACRQLARESRRQDG